MSQKSKSSIIFAIAFCSVALFGGLSSAYAQDRALTGDLEKLQQAALSQDTVKVIVGLETNFTAEGDLNSANAAQLQRDQIRSTQTSLLNDLAQSNVSGVKQYETIPFIALTVDRAALDALAANPNVVSIQEDGLAKPHLLQSVPFVDGDDVHAAGIDGSGWAVAVLDTGVRKTHVDLDNGKVVSEACYGTNDGTNQSSTLCPNGNQSQTGSGAGVNCRTTIDDGCSHGTHVAGIAAGTYGGVAPGASIIAIQVFSRFDSSSICGGSTPCLLSYTSDQLLGLERVYSLRNSIDIASVNMSLGGGQYFSGCSGDSRNSIISNLRSAGIATVISSGNNGYNGSVGAPGCIPKAITVGATLDNSNTISSYSNHAAMVDLLAPGSNITSSVAQNNSARETYNGTSMAAPHVAGAFALMREHKPSASVTEIEGALESTGVSIKRAGVTKPRIELYAAAQSITPIPEPDLTVDTPTLSDAMVTPNQSPITVETVVRNGGDDDSPSTTHRYYLSNNASINTNDEELTTDSVGTLAPAASSVQSTSITAPSEPGLYYVGACVDEVSREAVSSNNCSDSIQMVASPGLVADAYETDNSAGQATPIVEGQRQFHSIHTVGDSDWFSLSLDQAVVDFEVSTSFAGFAADTYLQLLDDGFNTIETDDNSGDDSFSKITVDQLDAGDYFVTVTEDGNNGTIEGYYFTATYEPDDDLILMIPSMIARMEPPAPPPQPDPQPRWGVINEVCCTVGSFTFSATISGSTKSSRADSCSVASTFSGYSNIAPGNSTVSSRYTSPSCGAASFSNFNLNLESQYDYLIASEFTGSSIVVNVYRRDTPNRESSASSALTKESNLVLVHTEVVPASGELGQQLLQGGATLEQIVIDR